MFMSALQKDRLSAKDELWHCDTQNYAVLALLPEQQLKLLKLWLNKSNGNKLKWVQKALKLATELLAFEGVNCAENLVETLLNSGLINVKKRRIASQLQNEELFWTDYERLCHELNITTKTVKKNAYQRRWEAAQELTWFNAEMAVVYADLEHENAETADKKLTLLTKLNSWCHQHKKGSQRVFSLFVGEQTKHQITDTNWKWLDTHFDLRACNIFAHSPVIRIAGNLTLKLVNGEINVAGINNFVGIAPETISRAQAILSGATHYRLVENLTSFEHLIETIDLSDTILIWLPGYAPSWWKSAVNRLLDKIPLPALISCDADPHGVEIAYKVGQLWQARQLTWQPCEMTAAVCLSSPHHMPMEQGDLKVANRLLLKKDLPEELRQLLCWCVENGKKAEQENWIGWF